MNKFVWVGGLAIVVIVIAVYFNSQAPARLSPTPTPSVTATDPNYTDSEFGYSLYVPEGFRVEEQGRYNRLFLPETDVLVGEIPTNFIYVSVVTPQARESNPDIYNYNPVHFNKLIALENVGDSVDLAADDVPELGEWFTYTLVGIENIGDGKAKNFENTRPWEFPAGTVENRFIYATGGNIYILGYYTGGDGVAPEMSIDPREAYKVVTSFRPS